MNLDKMYIVHDEKGGRFHVEAESKDDAIEKYWESMESVLGHIEGSCSCYKNPKPFPRSKYKQPVKVEKAINE